MDYGYKLTLNGELFAWEPTREQADYRMRYEREINGRKLIMANMTESEYRVEHLREPQDQ